MDSTTPPADTGGAAERMRHAAAASARTRHDMLQIRTDAIAEARARAGLDAAEIEAARRRWETELPPATVGLWKALREVSDPELPISLVDLGLIYDIRLDDSGAVDVDCTFTASACPCMDFIKDDIRERLLEHPGVTAVRVHEVWDPPWTVARMSEEGRAILRACGVAA